MVFNLTVLGFFCRISEIPFFLTLFCLFSHGYRPLNDDICHQVYIHFNQTF